MIDARHKYEVLEPFALDIEERLILIDLLQNEAVRIAQDPFTSLKLKLAPILSLINRLRQIGPKALVEAK